MYVVCAAYSMHVQCVAFSPVDRIDYSKGTDKGTLIQPLEYNV